MTPSEKLYQTAKKNLGRDLAPKEGILGCAETISNLCQLAFGPEEFYSVSTEDWEKHLESDPKWKEESEDLAQGGDIIISASGTQPANSPLKHGHIGILGRLKSPDNSVYIMSNNSAKLMLDTQWTLAKWQFFYGDQGGFPLRFFRRITI